MTKLIRQGFDTIELAYRAAVPEKFLLTLEDAKSRAIESKKPSTIDWNGHIILVEATGGQGGYAYRVETGRFGSIWKFRPIGSWDPWKAHVKMRAHALALKGLINCKEECDQFLRLLGASFDPNDARVGRADLAYDFYAPGVRVDPEHFVSHPRSTKSEHLERTLKGVETNYLRIGKLPGKQVCVYDKASLARDSNDAIWMDILQSALRKHGINPDPKVADIWRAEFRAGKKYLDRFLNPSRRWDLFLSQRQTIFRSILHTVVWRVPEQDTNRSRWSKHSIWETIETSLMFDLGSHDDASSLSAETLDQLQKEYRETLIAQTDGLILTQAALAGISPDSIEAFCLRSHRSIMRRLKARPNLAEDLLERNKRFQLNFSLSGGIRESS